MLGFLILLNYYLAMNPEELLVLLLKNIVKKPEAVTVLSQTDDMGLLLRVNVDRGDMGALIGKVGVHAKALKLVMKLVGYQNGKNISVKIEEPE